MQALMHALVPQLLLARLNYCWRLLGTAISFTVFGLGGLVLPLLVFPLLLVLPAARRLPPARWIIQQSFRLFLWMMETLGVMRLEVIGAERLRNCRDVLVLANHPTLIDAVALVALIPSASCVVKQAVWNNPLMGGVVRAADYISNSNPKQLVQACTEELVAGNPLVIFPEGTRSRPGEPLHFLCGPAYIALKSRLPVLPVLIDCTPSTLTKRERWYQIPSRRFHLRIEALEPLPISHWLPDAEPSAMAARKLTHALENYFTEELGGRHGRTAA